MAEAHKAAVAKRLVAKRLAVASRPKTSPSLAAGQQRNRYSKMLDAGSKPFPVYVRPRGSVDWYEIGEVSAAGDVSVQMAAQVQQRLIFSHDVSLHPDLQMLRDTLECGLAVDSPEDEPVPLVDVDAAELPAATECGFAGQPDPTHGHYWAESEQVLNAGKKVKLTRQGTDSKSKVAEAFSKMLGLRSG